MANALILFKNSTSWLTYTSVKFSGHSAVLSVLLVSAVLVSVVLLLIKGASAARLILSSSLPSSTSIHQAVALVTAHSGLIVLSSTVV